MKKPPTTRKPKRAPAKRAPAQPASKARSADADEGSPYPAEIIAMLDAIAALPSVRDVSTGLESLDGLGEADLQLPGEIAQLPIGALRRTKGGLPGEALVSFYFELEPNAGGWRTLEFLAWFIRDQARAGEPIQLRPFALPPQGPSGTQLGETLRFDIDLFWLDAGEELAPILARVKSIASDLVTATAMYEAALVSDE
jgi:hypothetical protein